MAIIEYVPPIKTIIDNRTSKGDYYKASCDVCGTEFYPKRRSAKYCNSNCKVIQHRIDIANGKIPKEIKKYTKKYEKGGVNSIRGASNVYKFLKGKYNTHGHRELIFSNCRDIDFGEYFEYGKFKIIRLSYQNFEVK